MRRTGVYGVVNGQSTVRNWSTNSVSEPKAYVASNTRGGTGRKRGIRDWTGSFGAYGAVPLLLPGQSFDFQGYTAPDNNTEGGNGPTYNGPAIVDSVAISFNWQNGDIPSYVVNFSGRGELLEASGLYSDVTIPDPPSFDEIELMVDDAEGSGSGSFNDWCDLLTATLTLTSANKGNVTSCTGGWRDRERGPLDWTMAVNIEETSQDNLPFAIGDDVVLRLKVNETDYWLLKWAHVQDFTGLTVNRESGDWITATVNFGMNGFVDGAIGEIRAPGDPPVTWWPG